MKRSVPAANPDAYVAALTGWRRACVEELRAAVRGAARLDEVVKWGHLVYLANGPVLLIRAEEERVLLGFWRGQRLRAVEPRLRPGGKYEMATAELRGRAHRAGDGTAPDRPGSRAERDVGRSGPRRAFDLIVVSPQPSGRATVTRCGRGAVVDPAHLRRSP